MTNLTKEDVQEVKTAHEHLNWTVELVPQMTEEGYLVHNPHFERTKFVIGDELVNEEIEGLKENGVEAIRYRILDENGKKQGGDYKYLVEDRDWNNLIYNHMEDIKYEKNIK
jgi:hypothetical protein